MPVGAAAADALAEMRLCVGAGVGDGALKRPGYLSTGAWRGDCGWRHVSHDLVTVEIIVDPVAIRAPLAAAEQRAVEIARRVEIVNGEGEMEGGNAHARSCAASGRANATAWASAKPIIAAAPYPASGVG